MGKKKYISIPVQLCCSSCGCTSDVSDQVDHNSECPHCGFFCLSISYSINIKINSIVWEEIENAR